MKMRITLEDVKQLNESQRRMLTELWKPEKYDVAMASMCTDVENEVYDEFEFVVGQIGIDKRANIFLYDIRNIPYENTEANSSENTSSGDGTEDGSEENSNAEGDYDIEYDSIYSRPSFFNKEDCVPLPSIGQMIELLQQRDFGNGDFFLTASTGEVGCEIGKNSSNWENYRGYEPHELCDVLWELVKVVL